VGGNSGECYAIAGAPIGFHVEARTSGPIGVEAGGRNSKLPLRASPIHPPIHLMAGSWSSSDKRR
jgi:hypothetical protein